MRSTYDITFSATFLLITHLVDHMSKQQMFADMENKEAITVSRVVHRWICIYGVMDILQSNNWSEFKRVCCNNAGTRPVPGTVRPVTGRGTQLLSEILQVHEFTSNTKPAHLMSPCQ